MKRTTLSLIAGATALAAVTGFASLTAPDGAAAPRAKAPTRLPVERAGLACPVPSTSEVAECLGVSDAVVKTRLSRGRALLRRLLMKRTGASAPEAFRFYRPRCDRVVAQVFARIGEERPPVA